MSYVYLQPELNQKWYVTTLPLVFLGILVYEVYYISKINWQSNKCESDLGPVFASMFGSSPKEWAQQCVYSPVESAVLGLQNAGANLGMTMLIDASKVTGAIKTNT